MFRKAILLAAAVALIAGSASAQIEVVTNDNALVTASNPLDTDCVRNGNYGMRATKVLNEAGSPAQAFVEATPPKANFNNETAVTVETWWNPNNYTLAANNRYFFLGAKKGTNSNPKRPFKVGHRLQDGNHVLKLRCKQATTGFEGPATDLQVAGDGWHLVRVTWAAGNLGQGDGTCRLEVVEGPMTGMVEIPGYESSAMTVGGVTLGVFGAKVLTPPQSGQACFDDFVATRTAP